MRTLDPECAPLLFGRITAEQPSIDDPLQAIIRFARARRELIISDNATLRDDLPAEGRWVLDLATTSNWVHLNHWGSKKRPLLVTCDDSKPLQATIPEFSGDENDPGIRRARMKDHQGHLGWSLSRPVKFAGSKDCAALQIADVIAGVAAYAIRPDVAENPEVASFQSSLHRHVLPACILPDRAVLDMRQKEVAVNAAVLVRLAMKAEEGCDVRAGLDLDYLIAEEAWDAGMLRMG